MKHWETALITGGGTGIGAALATELVRRGARVVICGRRIEPLQEMTRQLGDHCIAVQADISSAARASEVVAEAETLLGHLDLVVANAGFGRPRAGKDLTVEHIVPILETNVIGACATITAAIPKMVERGRGNLVGISSIAGYVGLPSSAPYSASKAALSTFLESLRVDLFGTGVQVTDIRPGFVDTPLTEKNRFRMPFLLSAEASARLILGAIADGRGVYAFPWQTHVAAKLLRLVPGWLYDRIGSRFAPKKG